MRSGYKAERDPAAKVQGSGGKVVECAGDPYLGTRKGFEIGKGLSSENERIQMKRARLWRATTSLSHLVPFGRDVWLLRGFHVSFSLSSLKALVFFPSWLKDLLFFWSGKRLEEHRQMIADADAVSLAIFFHDVIYDPRAGSPQLLGLGQLGVFGSLFFKGHVSASEQGFSGFQIQFEIRHWRYQFHAMSHQQKRTAQMPCCSKLNSICFLALGMRRTALSFSRTLCKNCHLEIPLGSKRGRWQARRCLTLASPYVFAFSSLFAGLLANLAAQVSRCCQWLLVCLVFVRSKDGLLLPELCKLCFQLSFPHQEVVTSMWIAEAKEQTAHHKCTEQDETDCKLFMDFDMAVLGRPWPQYELYSQQIRPILSSPDHLQHYLVAFQTPSCGHVEHVMLTLR